MKLSDYLVDFLIEQGTKHVFLLVGGACAHMVDSLYGRRPEIEPICMQHEQSVSFAAEAYSRIGPSVGVAVATSGPGATNMVTGIGSAYFDSIPCVFLTGQVNTYDYKGKSLQRQRGFQETDIVSIVKPITKYAAYIDDPEKIREELEKAFFIAKEGRPGPVLLDLPMNIQRAEIDKSSLTAFDSTTCSYGLTEKEGRIPPDQLPLKIKEVARDLRCSKRAVILSGGGVGLAQARDELLQLLDKTGIPSVITYGGKDTIPHDHPSFCGFVGNYGHRGANFTLANADLLLVLGSRLDTRTTGSRADLFAREAKIIHVEIDPHEVNQRVQCNKHICADIRDFLTALNRQIEEEPLGVEKEWQEKVHSYKTQYPWFPKEHPIEKSKVDPYEFLQVLSEEMEEEDIIVADNGQARVIALQLIKIGRKQRFISSVGMAPLGYGLPASIGAAYAGGARRVICLTGDGGLQLNIQELQTIFHYRVPLKIFVMNNFSYGMIKQFQNMYFGGRTYATGEGYSCPDFVKVAEGYKIESTTINTGLKLREGVRQALNSAAPFLCNVVLPEETEVVPKVNVNYPIEYGEPLLSHEEFSKNMIIKPYFPDKK